MICVPIMAKTAAQARRRVVAAAPLAEVLELRLDLIVGIGLEELVGAVRDARPVKILVTAGRQAAAQAAWEKAGGIQPTAANVAPLLARAVALGVDFIDVPLGTAPEEVAALRAAAATRGGKTRLIVSHHDFQETPPELELRGLFHACAVSADIVKLVTWAQRPEDNLTLLGIIPYARKHGGEIIAFCMGPLGRLSRIAAPLLGSYLSFAALKHGAGSAPGQLTVREMRKMLQLLTDDRQERQRDAQKT